MAQGLSNREKEVVQLLLQGKSNKMIALSLGITDRTVEFHLKNIYDKYQVSSRTELILLLGKPTDPLEPEKLGVSTVDEEVENTENRARFTSWMDRPISFRDMVSKFGKELRMNTTLGSDARSDDNNMTFFESIRVCFTKYAEFQGRASRAEFWWFALFVLLVTSALGYLSESLGSIFLIAVLLPFLAVGARRLRDSGNNPWWQLFLLVPVGGIVALGFLWAQPPVAALPDEAAPV